MKLEGIHHITAITAHAQRNVDFYADEEGDPGSDLTFFEFPGTPIGRAGAGMVHRVVWRVGSAEALDFWAERLKSAGYESQRDADSLRFADFEGLGHELLVSQVDDEPLIAEHPEVPSELALQGFEAARAFSADPERSRPRLEDTLGFTQRDGGWEARGDQRGGLYVYDEPPAEPGVQGAGSVHHIAWASRIEDHEAWRERVAEAGLDPTPIIDRFYFRSIYFREPSGVLFEIATIGPGFTVDEPAEHLGEGLALPPFLEDRREQIEPILTPIENPRQIKA